MSDPTREDIDAMASVLADDWSPERDPILTAMFRDYANTVLTSTDPDVHAALLAALVRAGMLWEERDDVLRPMRRYVTRWEDVEEPAGRSTMSLPIHRTEAGYPNCSTCDGGGCHDCTDPA